MNTKDLHCFIQCFECKSINKAAKELFITPQGLSRIIQNLEKEFETKLFSRSSNGILPTETGVMLYKDSLELLTKLEEIEIKMKRFTNQNNTVNIGYSYGVLNILPLYEIEQYRLKHTDLKIQWDELVNTEVKEKVKNGELDIGYIVGTVEDNKIGKEKLFETNICASIYEGHPYYNRDKIYIEDLRYEPLITLNEKYSYYSSFIQRCKDTGFIPDIKIKTIESQLIYKFCDQKLGIGIDVDIHDVNKLHPNLHCVKIEDTAPWIINVIYQKNRLNEKPIKDIVDFSKKICNKN